MFIKKKDSSIRPSNQVYLTIKLHIYILYISYLNYRAFVRSFSTRSSQKPQKCYKITIHILDLVNVPVWFNFG